MKDREIKIAAAEARLEQSKIALSQNYGVFKDRLKSAATTKKSFFATLLGGAALGYLSGSNSAPQKAKNKFFRSSKFSWVGSMSKLLLPYITGTLLGSIQTFLNKRAPKEAESHTQQ